ncbi:hypothetical protein MH117_05070 [Paenibacillus sp. ACRRX]|uniref:hypothetical protein n=1 Tax=Paenibacillus sp. ACRRX TaxID=2918206 RepID=UPI001EF528D9|nr:hypothetical protein [Paenibacillus sp. ACRRX]MCG7406782.1 hypothetical protein [Paenibacillus sp. ACRRX]
MKKLSLSLLALVLVLCLSTSAFAAGKPSPMKVTKDGITVEVLSATLEEIMGDRTKDNFSDKNGEYFAIGSNIVKASDYRKLALKVRYFNDRKTAISFPSMSVVAWTLTLPNGVKTKQFDKFEKLVGTVDSKSKVEETISIVVKKPSDKEKQKYVLTYGLLNYTEEFNKVLKDYMLGAITPKDWAKKYEKKFTPIDMVIKLQIK